MELKNQYNIINFDIMELNCFLVPTNKKQKIKDFLKFLKQNYIN